jgi:hypothetical protein
MSSIRPDRAIRALKRLQEEGRVPNIAADKVAVDTWQAKVRGVLVDAFGEDDQTVIRFSGIRYWPSGGSQNATETERIAARRLGVDEACADIDAAIHRLELRLGGDDSIDEASFDTDLWDHVSNLVADENWSAVASQTAIFLEHTLRRWAGDPKDKLGDSLYGQVLYATVLADDSDLRLGRRAAERQGWRSLGTGFASALGNVDRHRIQDREDARRYAIGVLGVASLILTQLRHEHDDLILEAEPPAGK